MGNLQKKPLECTVKKTNMSNSRILLCVQARYHFNIAMRKDMFKFNMAGIIAIY